MFFFSKKVINEKEISKENKALHLLEKNWFNPFISNP
jgi:hypothetical protein